MRTGNNATVLPNQQNVTSFTANPLWKELNGYIKSAYGIKPKISQNAGAVSRVWSVEYHINQRTLCTLYPETNTIDVIIYLNEQEEEMAESMMDCFSSYVQEIYNNTYNMPGGRWLVLHITNREILNDFIMLMMVRAKPRLQYKDAQQTIWYSLLETFFKRKTVYDKQVCGTLKVVSANKGAH